MGNHFFALLSRMKNIHRWGLMRNTRLENLSEHSLETAFIAHALAVIKNRRLGGNVDASFVALSAMFHDTSEIITGDMPTPVKYYNDEIRDIYKKIESTATKRLLSCLPDDLKPEYESIYNPDPEIQKIIKAADKISAYIKCIEETNSGNREFEAAKESTLKLIHNLNMPEAEIFLEEFAPSFSLPLDQQQL